MTKNRRPQRPTRRTLLRSSRAPIVWACLAAGCGAATLEEQVLRRFFAASLTYDQAALEKVATVAFNPVTDGIVSDFVVAGVEATGERRVVSVDAAVRRRTGTALERLRVVLERRAGRWLVTEVTRPRASQTSRGASSAPPY